MIKKIDNLLFSMSPKLHQFTKRTYNDLKKKIHPKLTESEFVKIITKELSISKGDVVFIHSSMRNLYLNFSKNKILSMLMEVVGNEGTLLFPCWQFNIRAEDYIKDNDPVFDIKNSPSAMGKMSDVLREHPQAFRSFHPTNSVVAIGKYAALLTSDHAKDILPCGVRSPFYKMKELHAKIIGIGVNVDNLTFVHTVEDLMQDQFPIKTRLDEVFSCNCIDENGHIVKIDTKVASQEIGKRDVFGFFSKYIKNSNYVFLKAKGMNFFSVNSKELFDEMTKLAFEGKTIYSQ